MMLETVTPPIGSTDACGCGGTVVWDEVHGWMHIRDTTPAVSAAGHLPQPHEPHHRGTPAQRT